MMVMKLFSQQKQKAILMFAFLPLFYSFSRGYGSSCLSKLLVCCNYIPLIQDKKTKILTFISIGLAHSACYQRGK